MPIEVPISLRPRYEIGVNLAAPGAALTLLESIQGGLSVSLSAPASALVLQGAQGEIAAELAPILRGAKGEPGSALAVYTAAAALSGHVVVTLDAAGKAVAADCRTAAHASAVLGASTGAAAAGADVVVLGAGLLASPGWGLTPGLPVYLGEAGALVQVLPPSALFIKPLGRALTSSTVLIELQPAIFLT